MTAADQDVQGSVVNIINDFAKTSLSSDVSKNALKLIQALERSQESFQPSEPEKEPLDVSIYNAGELAETVSLDLCYAIKRLIRGLASSNSDIRIRYGIALAAIFSHFCDILPISVVRKWSLALLTGQVIFGSSSMSRGEQSSLFSAKLAFIASVLEGYPSSKWLSDVAISQEMVVELISIIKARTFLRESVFTVLLTMLSLFSDLSPVYPLLSQIPMSADFLKFLHELEIPKVETLLQISPQLENFPVFNNTTVVMKCLFETISTSTQPHSLWIAFVNFLKSDSKLQEFWSESLEADLIGSDSVEKKIIGIMIFESICNDPSFVLQSKLLWNLYNAVGPNAGSKAKGKLPLTMAVEKSLRNLSSNEKALQQYADNFLALPAFQRLPFWFLDAFFQACGPSKLQSYWDALISKLHSLSESSMVYQIFDAINNLTRLPSFKFVNAKAANELLQFQLKFCLLNPVRDLDPKVLSTKLQTTLTAHLRHDLPEKVLEAVFIWLKDHKTELKVDDEIVTDVLKKTSKCLAKCEQLTELSSSDNNLLLVTRMLLHITYLWLYIDPVVVADFSDDLAQIISDFKRSQSSRKSKSDIAPIEVICDLILRLLSSSSLFLRQVCEHMVKLLIPCLTKNSFDLFLNVLSTSSKSGLEDELLEDFGNSENNDTDGDTENDDKVEADFSQFSLPVKRDNDAELSEDENVNLDDADEKELAMFDAKLCEIFKLKKDAKKAKTETKRTTIEFKSKILSCLRVLFTSKSPSLSGELRLEMLLPLLKTAQLNMVDPDSKHLGVSILAFLKQSLRAFDSQHGSLENAKMMCNAIIDFVKTKIWNNHALLEASLVCVCALLKILPSCKAEPLMQSILRDLWKFGISSRKIQKTKYFSFLGILDQKAAGCCWPLVCSEEWISEFDDLHAQSKDLVISFLLRSIKCGKDDQSKMFTSFSSILIKYYGQKLQTFTKETKLSQLKNDVDLISTLSRRCHSLGLPTNDWASVFKAALSILDKNGQNYIRNVAKNLRLSL